MAVLTREQIIEALERLDAGLGARGTHAELYVVGGAVMCVAYGVRPATKDVDAWFTEPEAVRAAARDVAVDLGLPPDWLNDAAKAFSRLKEPVGDTSCAIPWISFW